MKITKVFLFAILFFTNASQSFGAIARAQSSEVVAIRRCNDGDTCRATKSNGKEFRIRLSGIDAPESKQPFGNTSRNFLESLVKNAKVTVTCTGRSFDRETCVIFKDGKNVGEEMVKAGLAWDSPKYSKGKYSAYQKIAKETRTGLWSQKEVESPFCHREKSGKAKRLCSSNRQYQE